MQIVSLFNLWVVVAYALCACACECTNEKKRQRSSKESTAPTDTSNCQEYVQRIRKRVSSKSQMKLEEREGNSCARNEGLGRRLPKRAQQRTRRGVNEPASGIEGERELEIGWERLRAESC